MKTRVVASLVILAGVLSGCASSRESYPAASPSTYPDGRDVIRTDTVAASDWVQRPRASAPAPQAPFATTR